MIRRIVTWGALAPLLIILMLWMHENGKHFAERTDRTVYDIRRPR